MSKNKQKVLSLLLAAALVVGMIPMTAFADEQDLTDVAEENRVVLEEEIDNSSEESYPSEDNLDEVTGDLVVEDVMEQEELLGEEELEWASCGENAEWAVTSDNTLIIRGTGAIDDCASAAKKPWQAKYRTVTKVVVEEGITAIGNYNFSMMANALTYEFPSTLKSIGQSAFIGITKLVSITLPANIEYIHEKAFAAQLKEIHFLGTAEQWNEIGYETTAVVYDKDGNRVGVSDDGRYLRKISLKSGSFELLRNFDPEQSEYSIDIPSTVTTVVLQMAAGRTDMSNVRFQIDSCIEGIWTTGSLVDNKPFTDKQMGSSSMYFTIPDVGESGAIRVKVGVPNEDGQFTTDNSDVYTINIVRSVYPGSLYITSGSDGESIVTNQSLSDATLYTNFAYTGYLKYGEESIRISANKLNYIDTRYSLDGGESYRDIFIDDMKSVVINLSDMPINEAGFPYVIVKAFYNGTGIANDSPAYTITFDNSEAQDYSPTITRQPQKEVVCNKGDDVYLSAEVEPVDSSVGTLTYSWTSSGIQPGNGSTAVEKKFPTDKPGEYCYVLHVILTRPNGVKYITTSDEVKVTVLPTYVDEPVEYSAACKLDTFTYKVHQNQEEQDVYYQAKSSDGAAISYEWYACESENAALLHQGERVDIREVWLKDSRGISCGPVIDTSAPCEKWYYCKVTATLNGVDGQPMTASIYSQPAKVIVEAIEVPFEGEGTETVPYLLKTAEDMDELNRMVDEGERFYNCYFKLANDIELSEDWDPIGRLRPGEELAKGSTIMPFAGTLDGDGHLLTIPEGKAGIFDYTRDALIKNLSVYGKDIQGCAILNNGYTDYGDDDTYNTGCPSRITLDNVTLKSGSVTSGAGMILGAGSGANTCIIRNSVVEENVTVHGGSFSYSMNGLIDGCSSAATVISGGVAGGIVGYKNQSMGAFLISNCVFSGTVTGTEWVGGIVGKGYYAPSAPNTPAAMIKNCYVTGTVIGENYVGGIFGGGQGLEDCWSNGVGMTDACAFYGTIQATGENVGAIVGYLQSFNIYQTVTGNVYSAECGVDKGVGCMNHVITKDDPELSKAANGYPSGYEYVDSEHNHKLTAEELKDGTSLPILNNSLHSSKNWVQGENGPVFSDKPIATALKISGEYKDTYYIGEELDLTGMQVTVEWNDGTTSTIDLEELEIASFDKEKHGIQNVTVRYGAAETTISVTVLVRSTEDITVTVIIKGDEEHGDNGEIHILKEGGLITWVESTSIAIDPNSTVWDALQALAEKIYDEGEHTIKYQNPSGNYVESITFDTVTIGEFTNGNNSGWMYTLNGQYPMLGVSEQFLADGDLIVFHYTDDYTLEEAEMDGHSFGEWTVIKDATCGESGSRVHECTICSYKETEEIPATGKHTWDAGKVTKEATETKEGEKTYTCTVCGDTKTEKIPKKTPEKPAVKTQSMYRLYNPNSGEHFYTASKGEKDGLVKLGWKYEGIGWIAPKTSKTPVYRLYNPNAGDHHYTTSKGERDALVKVGWKYEQIGWYSDDAKGVALYRQYNPNAKTGTHNYTTSKKENDWLVSLGWKAEGIGWYGVKAS